MQLFALLECGSGARRLHTLLCTMGQPRGVVALRMETRWLVYSAMSPTRWRRGWSICGTGECVATRARALSRLLRRVSLGALLEAPLEALLGVCPATAIVRDTTALGTDSMCLAWGISS